MGQRKSPQFEASNFIKQQPSGYASAVIRDHCLPEAALQKLLELVVEKAITKFMDRFLSAFTSSVAEVLVINVVQVLQHIVPSINLSMPTQTCPPFQAFNVDSHILPLLPSKNRSISDTDAPGASQTRSQASLKLPTVSTSLQFASSDSEMDAASTPYIRSSSPLTLPPTGLSRSPKKLDISRSTTAMQNEVMQAVLSILES